MKRSRILKFTFFVFALIVDAILLNFNLRNKFKDITIELGTENIKINDFLVSPLYLKNSKCLTNLNSIDINEVSSYNLEFSYGGKRELVKLEIVDTTAPTVEFTNLEKGLDYKFDANDFVTLVKDKSAYTITSEVDLNNIHIGDNSVLIAVTDEYGNKTTKQCNLNIGVFKSTIHHELGEPLTAQEILITDGYGNDSITPEILKQINQNQEGSYEITLMFEEEKYVTKINVKDTKGPDIIVNNINFYLGGTPKKNEDFIKSISDASGVKDVIYDGSLDYKKIGIYELKIKAIDTLGNESEVIATLNVRDDNIGPVISGLSTIYAAKNQEIDFYKGVTSKDAKDGVREFTVDASGVNTAASGTYYAIYKSSDTSNNITTKKRKVVVSYNMEDLNNMARSYYDKYLVGKSVLEITKFIHDKNGYSHTYGSDLDALYQILTRKTGSCRGHAFLMEKVLTYAGYQNKVIKTIDGSHYWNLVYENGIWRHYDSVGGHIRGPATDAEKLASKGMHGRKWDFSAYPAAN